MIRSLLISSFLFALPSCDAAGRLFGQEPEGRQPPKAQALLPASRNAGVVPKGKRQEALPLEVGQWTRHVIHHRGGKTTEYFRQIVEKEPGGFRLEIVNGTPNAGTITQLLVSVPTSGRGVPSVVSAKVRMPNGVIKEISGPAMDATRSGYQHLLADVELGTTWAGAQSDVRVLAGDFTGCSESPTQLQFAGLEGMEKAYYHPRVPIGGLVKGLAADGHTVVELTGFGTDGAESVIERKLKAR